MTLHSAIYTGTVRHRRRHPAHAFTFPLYMAYLDLAELDEVFTMSRWWGRSPLSPARFCRDDYLHHGSLGLADSVRAMVADHTGRMPDGPVRMLTHLRNFGYTFNPVTFYYCFTPGGDLDAIVSQITNTPWKERHSYILDARAAKTTRRAHTWTFDKAFHVSPFMPMALGYDWSFTTPGGEPQSTLLVHMNLHPLPPGPQTDSTPAPDEPIAGARAARPVKPFDATLQLTRSPLTPASMRAAILRYPFITARVITSIHLHALRLWLKKATVYPHPSTLINKANA
ncbi:MAG: DUF1365 domain-containing protein [Phycisphaerales bacterium]|nr:DUF1365 domain-containing protein [Phycisphaerales bacterium]